jgi:hypothetical protein
MSRAAIRCGRVGSVRLLQEASAFASRQGVHGVKRRLSSSSSAQGAEDPGAYCVELVKKNDLDGYYCGLLMPKSARSVHCITALEYTKTGKYPPCNQQRKLMQASLLRASGFQR